MSEEIHHKGPKPRTRSEILADEHCERGLWGREVHATATEPLPDIAETGYQGVLAREVPTNGLELKHRGLVISTLTMVGVSLITFYFPLINSLMGGVFGGFFARRWGRAFAAAALASVAVPGTLAFFYGFDSPDFLYMFYGLGFWGFAALNALGMFIGAASGVYSRPLADRRAFPRRHITG
jgi:hypothetical protein